MIVGISGGRRDPHVKLLRAALRARGAEVAVVDFSGFPKLSQARLGSTRSWRYDDIAQLAPIALDELGVVFVRGASVRDLTWADAGETSADELRRGSRRRRSKLAYQASLLKALARRVPVINSPDAFLFHRQKGWQGALLLRHGVPTPSSLVTSDLDEARAFVERFEGEVVVKPQASGAVVVRADEAFFADRALRRSRRPFLYQQLVSGRSYRVYLLGGEVACAGEIIHDRSRIDWRGRTERVEPYDPPRELRDELRRAVRLLGLPYCGVDLEHDERTDRIYLLDVNPNAYFAEVERLFGVNFPDLLAAYLLEAAIAPALAFQR